MVQCSRCKRACRSTGGRLESHAGRAERRDSAVWATGLSMCNPVCSAGKCNIPGFSLLRQWAAAVFAPGFAAKSRLLGKEGPGHLGGSLFVWVQKSAWVNASTMRRWLSLLRKALQPRVGARTVLVFVEAAPPHLHASVWAHAKRCAVRLLLIPRGLTRLLKRQSRCRAVCSV